MKIQVQVKTNSGKQEIDNFGDNHYFVYLKSAPENNEANIELIKLIGKHFGVPSTKIKIISGATSKNKTLEINY